MAPGATGAVGPPYSEKPGQSASAVVFTLPIALHPRFLVTLLRTLVNDPSTPLVRLSPVRPGSSARANSVAKQIGLAAA